MNVVDLKEKEAVAAAFNELIENTRKAERTVAENAIDARELAEGYRFLTRAMSLAFDQLIEKNDTRFPKFLRVTDAHRKYFGDNPDTYYDRVPLDGRLSYRIFGNRGSVPYMGLCVYGGGIKNLNIVSHIKDSEMEFEPNGDFEIILSRERPADAGNWCKIDESARLLLMRQYFFDREKTGAAHYEVEVLDDVGARPGLAPERIANDIRACARFMPFVTGLSVQLSDDLARKPNAISIDSRNGEGVVSFFPTHDNDYFIGWYDLKEDEALIVEGTPPDCIYWSLTLYNRWFESYEFEHRQVHLNNKQINLCDDGSYRFVISEEKPEGENWLETDGLREGMLAFRWLGRNSVVEEPSIRVVKTADLRAGTA